MEREELLRNIFKDVSKQEQDLINPLIEEVIYLEEQMKYLRTLPHIKIHPQNKEIQKKTEAAKLYKEYMQSYMNAIRIMVGVLHKNDTQEQNELLKRLAEFE